MILLITSPFINLSNIVSWLIILVVLAAILHYTLNKLVRQKRVSININDEKYLDVEPEFSLLSILAKENIYLPSACGGSGTCGKCKCKVLKGGGLAQPLENEYFSQEELADHWRLACQIMVRNDMKIQLYEK